MSASHSTARSRVRLRAALIALTALSVAAAGHPPAGAGPDQPPTPPGAPSSMRARGLVYKGLHADPAGRCGRGYEVSVAHGGRRPLCSHGPDPAPAGVDVRDEVSTQEAASVEVAAAGDPVCIDDGSTGPRVRAIYAVASDRTDRYAALVDSIRTWAGHVQETFALSALETGGERDVRFLTEPDGEGCRIVVDKLVLTPTGDDSFSNTIAELQTAGYDRADRRYLAWVDANAYCGIATMYLDDRPTGNLNDGAAPLYGRVDQGCWGRYSPGSNRASVEAHELLHSMGGVQDSAPNATPYGHCRDEDDGMCYLDGPGVTMRSVCSGHEALFDCGHNDYFHTNPPAANYLATHWNVADSSFLLAGADSGAAVARRLRTARISRLTSRWRMQGRIRVLDGYGACRERVPVRVQRKRSDGRWVTKAWGRTGLTGGYTMRIKRKNGRYRVVAPRVLRGGGDDACLVARSKSIRVRR